MTAYRKVYEELHSKDPSIVLPTSSSLLANMRDNHPQSMPISNQNATSHVHPMQPGAVMVPGASRLDDGHYLYEVS